MKKSNKLTPGERDRIALWYSRKLSSRKIARKLGRDPATICREIKRNSFGNHYVAIHAQTKTEKKRSRSGRKSSLQDPLIYSYVIEKLRWGWSPQQIAGRLPRDHSGKSIHWETVYRFIYSEKVKTKKLFEYLPRKHKKRRRKFGRKVERSRIPDRVSIHERPSEIENRNIFGHWEGDSVVGRWHQSGIHTQVERKTRFLKAKLISDFTANETLKAQHQVFNHLPRTVKKSTTVDNGKEFTHHQRFNLPVYFCDPYSSWQKGTNENTNGLIRRYLPKKTDFRRITQQDLDDIVEEINNRPRKCLGYQTPKEVFTNELSVAIKVRM